MSRLTRAQYDYLVQGIAPSRVQHLKGQAHLQAWDVRRTLNRVFGFCGWDQVLDEVVLVSEVAAEKGGRMGYTVVYRVTLQLTLKDAEGKFLASYTEAACGDAINQTSLGDAHDLALKTAESQALKRCAANLGDQFGLGLYNGGRTDPVVNRTLVVPGESVLTAKELKEQAEKDAPVEDEPERVTDEDAGQHAELARRAAEMDERHTPAVYTQDDAIKILVDELGASIIADADLKAIASRVAEALQGGYVEGVPTLQREGGRNVMTVGDLWLQRLVKEANEAYVADKPLDPKSVDRLGDVWRVANGTGMLSRKTPGGKTLNAIIAAQVNEVKKRSVKETPPGPSSVDELVPGE